MFLTDEHAELMKKHAGEKYRPSNGTEGEFFYAAYCARCVGEEKSREEPGQGCHILTATLVHDIKEEGYPEEWQIGQDGQPTCTAFTLRPDVAQ